MARGARRFVLAASSIALAVPAALMLVPSAAGTALAASPSRTSVSQGAVHHDEDFWIAHGNNRGMVHDNDIGIGHGWEYGTADSHIIHDPG